MVSREPSSTAVEKPATLITSITASRHVCPHHEIGGCGPSGVGVSTEENLAVGSGPGHRTADVRDPLLWSRPRPPGRDLQPMPGGAGRGRLEP
ncbi:hypothetical protein GCM10009737_21190 [Nocardioides lentus]|uniref:Uncharacterized protein n=1 Tax=Nocardioides lentus TaxID=338077 RepID=A0ABP5ATP7_9ACTN